MKKIALIGSGGSGKSTLARKLGELTKLNVYHLDALHFQPGWVPMPNDQWEHLQKQLIQEQEWIIDGNYGRTIDIRLNEADVIIFFDLPRRITTYRVIKRRIMYHGKTRPDLKEGCPERLDWPFVKWVWNYRATKRPAIMKKLHTLSAAKIVFVIKSNADIKRLLEQIQNGESLQSNLS
ncbi:DNA topology modulation protein [Paenibacillus sp. LMG 31456]|uniref:DNA topology modulation protein n=1 Tax=Paenibacillus foliorum TaxID=2654974 RepID=A0A972GVW3_9BACL|nr:DNA topology modulation protein [Paenibacillus foliorum]NOU97879.1 DNA topology modulation protein [Paenibacillus foliorum]